MKTFVLKTKEGGRPSREESLAAEMAKPPWHVEEISGWLGAKELGERAGFSSIIIVFDPYFFYPPVAWKHWAHALEEEGLEGVINVPLGNQSPTWIKQTGAPLYLTVSGLENAAAYSGPQGWLTVRAQSAGEFCVAAVPVEKLLEAPETCLVQELPDFWARKRVEVRVFCRGWLHSFGAVKEAEYRYDLLGMCEWKGMVFELGCARGLMAKACKEKGSGVVWTGIDINESHLREAKRYIDLPVMADLQDPLPLRPGMLFDRIVCADILEHLAYPWELLSELRGWIKPDGLLVCAVPNVGHWSVIQDLLCGRWDEAPSGLFCVTHLRFGTRKSWERWFNNAGWETLRWERETVGMPENWLGSALGQKEGWDFESLETVRYRVLARPSQ